MDDVVFLVISRLISMDDVVFLVISRADPYGRRGVSCYLQG